MSENRCRHRVDGGARQCGRPRSPLELVREFHRAHPGQAPDPWSREGLRLRRALIKEEAMETIAELDAFIVKPDYLLGYDPIPSRTKLAKELADLVYVVYGTAERLGIDLDRVLEAVHQSNMSKFEGCVQRREDGKVLKGPNYRAPDLSFLED